MLQYVYVPTEWNYAFNLTVDKYIYTDWAKLRL